MKPIPLAAAVLFCVFAADLFARTPEEWEEEAVEKEYFLSFEEKGVARTNGLVPELVLVQSNQQGNNSGVVFKAAGVSKLAWEFDIPAKPAKAALKIEHLSSGARVELGGVSRISILINGKTAVSEWDVGTHVFDTDRIMITKFLSLGRNRIEIRFAGGPTCYWLKKVSVACSFPAGTDFDPGKTERIPADKESAYAVVARRAVYEKPGWRAVVDTLAARHDAAVILYPYDVTQARDELSAVFPRHVCFVSPPEEAGRRFVAKVHRMTRLLDQDPYGDVIWGIVTGLDAQAALKLATDEEPLTVRSAAAGCNRDLGFFMEGRAYSEGEQGVMYVKNPGMEPEKKECPGDATEAIVRTLNEEMPDIFITSGHATEHDWQIGYSFKSGQLRCEKGRLYGLDTKGNRYDIDSPNPKVYCAGGNCLIGRIDGLDSMALGWLSSGGARQMYGYTVSTWYGYMGWGVLDYFVRLQGAHTLAESFFFSNQALVERLCREYPGSLDRKVTDFNIEHDKAAINRASAEVQARSKDELGLQWDRDTVVFYGDPAWEARTAGVREPDYECSLENSVIEESGRVRFVFEVKVNRTGIPRRPPAALLPFRISEIKIENAQGPAPVITDNFVLLPVQHEFKKGARLKVTFSGMR